MKRRSFFTMFGFGAAASVAGASKAVGAPEKRDIHWARRRCQEGYRVRLPSWCAPIWERRKRPEDGNPSVITVTQGTSMGVASVDGLTMTPEMLEGPWEIVPPEDYPKPPPPPSWETTPGVGGSITLVSGAATTGGTFYLRGEGGPSFDY